MRRDLDCHRPGQTWRGLEFTATGAPTRPALRPVVLGPHTMMLVQGTDTLLAARVDGRWQELTLERRGAVSDVVGPITADRSRRIGESDGADWWTRWAHHLCDALQITTFGPVHPGRWMLRSLRLADPTAPELRELTTDDAEVVTFDDLRSVRLDLVRTATSVVPLRPLSEKDSARVHAWSKHIDDRSLPPVVLWWVAGLCSWVVIDGHDRLVAARSHGVTPPMLGLSELVPLDDVRDRYAWTDLDDAARLERVMEQQPEHWAAHEALARQLVATIVRLNEVPRTSAWTS